MPHNMKNDCLFCHSNVSFSNTFKPHKSSLIFFSNHDMNSEKNIFPGVVKTRNNCKEITTEFFF